MMIEFKEDSACGRYGAEVLWRDLWLDHARSGIIWIPRLVSNDWSQAIRMALYGLRQEPNIEVLIDCQGGEDKSFDPCLELLWRYRNGKRTQTCVIGLAQSIGLSYVVAATYRTALPDAQFLVHGEGLRSGTRHESGVYLEDHYMANWLARFTRRTYEDWLAYAGDGENHPFGVAEALEWGVIDEVLEGV